MTPSSDMATRILDAAEARARNGGYNGFSFRELARDVGIKSASVHYHFDTKETLVVSLARRYRKRFMSELGDPRGKTAIQRWIDQFRHALLHEDKMCLCGILGAERDGLPDPVAVEVSRFFEDNLAWLGRALPPEIASVALSLMEGGLLLARATRQNAHFERAAGKLESIVEESKKLEPIS